MSLQDSGMFGTEPDEVYGRTPKGGKWAIADTCKCLALLVGDAVRHVSGGDVL